jgi:hypothetical protein
MPHTLFRHNVVPNITRPPATRYYLAKGTKHNFWVDDLLQVCSLIRGIVTAPYCFWVTSFDDFFNVDIFKETGGPDSRDTDRVRFWQKHLLGQKHQMRKYFIVVRHVHEKQNWKSLIFIFRQRLNNSCRWYFCGFYFFFFTIDTRRQIIDMSISFSISCIIF